MSNNNDIKLTFKVDVDKKSINDTIKSLKEIGKEIDNVGAGADGLRARLSAGGGGGISAGISSRRTSSPSTSAGTGIDRELAGLRQSLQNTSGGVSDFRGNVSDFGDVALGVADTLASGGGIIDVVGQIAQISPLASAGLGLFQSALALTQQEAQRGADELNSRIDAQRELDEAIVDGLTSQDAQAQISRLSELRDLEQDRLDRLEEGARQLEEQFGPLTGVLEELQPQVGAVMDELDESRAIFEAYGNEIENLQGALDEGRLATNDAESAESDLAGSRDDGAREAEKLAKEEEKRQEKIADAIRESGEAVEDARRNFANASDDIRKETSRNLSDARRGAKRALSDLATEARRGAEQAGRAYNDARLEADKQGAEEQRQQIVAFNREIRDIIRQANRDQSDLLAQRDFLAIDQLSKETQRALEDTGIAANDERSDLLDAQQIRRDDLKRSYQIDRREARVASNQRAKDTRKALRDELSDIRRAGRRKLEDQRTLLQREIEQAQIALKRKLELEGAFYEQSLALASRLSGGSLGAGAGSISNTSNSRTSNNANITINGSNSAQMQRIVIDTLQQTGMIQ